MLLKISQTIQPVCKDGHLGLRPGQPPAILEISFKIQHVWGPVWALGLSQPLFA